VNTTPLSAQTLRRAAIVFAPADLEQAHRLLVEECGNNLPFCERLDAHQLERVRFAALKLSGGRLDELRRAIALAKTDWRDLLMAAGFGQDVRAHERWLADADKRPT
jgi:hypothetical protein